MPKKTNLKTIFVNDLTEGQQLNDLFLVSRKNLGETKNGKPYLALSLMDRTGEIEARIWDNATHYDAQTEIGKVVAVEAQVKAYREKLQLSIFSLSPIAENETQLGHFIPCSKRPNSKMQEELTGLIQDISDQYLRTLLETIFQGDVLKDFSNAPAAKHMHHAYIGGLLEHTLSVTGLAIKLAHHYPELNRDLLVAGALLHDLGKIEEFSFTTIPFDYTDSGRLVGHLVLGAEMVRKAADKIGNIPSETLNQLIHLILSHHGRHEFGAPCLPMTTEAILLHHIDDIDAKMNFIDRLSEQVEPGDYQWSDYQRTLERFIFLKGRQKETDDHHPLESFSQSQDGDTEEKVKKEQGSPGEAAPLSKQGKLF